MKTWFLPLALLTICLAATSAVAQNDIYDNGPTDGRSLGWLINFGSAMSNTFTVSNASTIDGLTFAAWLFSGDVLETTEVSITSYEFGGTSYFDQTVNFTASGCFSNGEGFNVCNETASFPGFNLNPGTYWLNLQNGVDKSGYGVFWDMNSGPSQASNASVGTMPSESFTILGHQQTGTGTTPEPGSILLFGSGILGISGVLRRKLF